MEAKHLRRRQRSKCRRALTIAWPLALLAQGVLADDTEIYFTNDAATESVANVLLVLDYSGSMKLSPEGDTLADPLNDPNSRVAIMRRVVEKVVNGAPSSIAMGVVNYGGHTFPATANGIKYPVKVLTTEQRQGVLDTVNGFVPEGYTPIVQSLYEASLYFRGAPADYGNDPNPVLAAADSTLAAGQDPAATTPVERQATCLLGDPVCNDKGFVAGSAACTAYPAKPAETIEIQDCIREDEAGQCLEFGPKRTVTIPPRDAYTECTFTVTDLQPRYNRIYQSPISNECQANYIVLLSDGLPDDGVKPGGDPDIKIKIANEYGLNCNELTGELGDGTCGPELTAHLANTDLLDAQPDKQTVKTYAIGFANSADGNSYLQALANLGEDSAGQQAFFTAADENRLLQVFNDIINDIAGNVSLLTPPVFSQDVGGFSTGTDAYLPLFQPSQLPDWRGNLKKYAFRDGILVGENGEPAFAADGSVSDKVRSFWSTEVDGAAVAKGGAANLLTPTRRLFTDQGNQLVAMTQTLFTEQSLGLDAAGYEGMTPEQLFTFAKGLEPDAATARKKMGDFLHSRPVLVDYGDRQVLFAGSNDGYLYAIDADTGEELFAFMPQALFPNLKTLLKNDATEAHPYGVDGTLTVFRSENGSILLYFGLRRGGRHYYALDISEPDAPLLQWHIDGGVGSFANLGQSWSKPIAAVIEEVKGGAQREAVLFGGGYDPLEDGTCSDPNLPLQKCPVDKLVLTPRQVDTLGRNIYAVDAHTGELIWSIGTGNATYTVNDMQNAVAANLAVLDLDSNGIVDRIYAADVGGRIFRVDLPDSENRLLVESAKVDTPQTVLFADLGGAGVQGNRRFYHEPDVAVLRDGLKRYISVAIGSGYQAHPLVKGEQAVQDRLYVLKDFGVTGLPDADSLPRENQDLVDATTVVPDKAPYGWYIDLDSVAGEKALARAATLQGKVFFTTFSPATPPENVCTAPLHTGAVYSINANNGAAVRQPGDLGDWKPAKVAGKQEFSTADIPSEVYQTFATNADGEVTVTTHLGPGQGAQVVDKTVFDAVQRVYWEEVH